MIVYIINLRKVISRQVLEKCFKVSGELSLHNFDFDKNRNPLKMFEIVFEKRNYREKFAHDVI